MTEQLAPVLDYAFLSSPDSPETFIVERSGRVRRWEEGVADGLVARRGEQELPELFRIPHAAETQWRWRQGFLPVLEIGDRYMLFAHGDELWCREEETCRRFPGGGLLGRDDFEKAAAELEKHWKNWLGAGILLPDVSPALDAAWRMSLIHVRCAFAGRHPKYGVEKYGEFRADGFPPTIISMCGTLREFGHMDEARDLFPYWLDRFVRSDGTIDYYGTSLSEYGMLLAQAAALSAGEGGREWFEKIHPFLTALCRYLYNTMNPWMHGPASAYFLPCGSPEADRRREKGEYFHNAGWIWRGLTETARQFGAWMPKEELWELRHIAGVLKRRLERAWRERRQALGGFPPFSVSQTEPFTDCGSSVERAYANYRYYPEMLSSGAFDREDMAALIDVRRKCRGETAGMTRLCWPEAAAEVADHWTLCSYARGLLECGEKDLFAELLRAHLLNYISPDLFYAYETVTVRGTPRRAWSDWCVPAQLTLPRLLLWSYSYTAWDGSFRRWGGPDPECAALFEKRHAGC